MDPLERVPGINWKKLVIYWKQFRYICERVTGIYIKEFQVPTGKSSRDRLEKVRYLLETVWVPI
jgi:hypothetical protein